MPRKRKVKHTAKANETNKKLLHEYIDGFQDEIFVIKLAGQEAYQNDIRIKDKYGNYPIFYSSHNQFYQLTFLLLEKYPLAIEKQGSWTGTQNPLHAACYCRNLNCVKFLVENFAILLFATNHIGQTPLFSAVVSNSSEIIHCLLNKAITIINLTNDDGETALIVGCKNYSFDAVTKLLTYDEIDVNIIDMDGHTALFNLFRNFLCHNAMDTDNTNYDNRRIKNDIIPIIELMHLHHPSAFYYFNPEGGNLFHELANDDYTGRVQSVEIFFRSIHQMVNDYDKAGKTPLHIACIAGNIHVIDFLVVFPTLIF
jgi:ankyrin repeat protein